MSGEPDRLVAADLLDLSDQELQQHRTYVAVAVNNINAQLENWRTGELPEHMLTQEWHRRARAAKVWWTNRLSEARAEITRRQLEKEVRLPPRETPEQKAARIAATEAAQRDEARAFIRAARRALGEQKFTEIWDLARELFPEYFAKDKELI